MNYCKILYYRIRYHSVFSTLTNHLFFLVIGIFFAVLICFHWLFGFLFVGYLCFLWRRNKIIFICSFAVSLLSLISYGIWGLAERDITVPLEGTIIQIIKNEENERWVIKSEGIKIYAYVSSSENVHVGWKVKIDGTVENIDKNRVLFGFNYKEYLHYNHIHTIIKVREVNIISRKFHLFRIEEGTRNWINQHFEKESKSFLLALITGDDSDFDDSLQESLQRNGIVHLFAVSGLHITLLLSMINKILNKNTWTKKVTGKITLIVLFSYCIITRFTPSILRAGLVYVLSQVNMKYKLGLPSLDIHSIVFVVLMIINPYYLFRIGFVFSFLVSFTIVLTSPLIKNKNSITQILIISIFAQIITFPFVVNLNHEINILSPFTNIFAILYVSSILLPCSFITLIFPFLEPFYQGIVTFFIRCSFLFSNYLSWSISFRHLSWFIIFIYYALVYFIIKMYNKPTLRKWLQFVIVLFVLFLGQAKWFIQYGTIDFLDLYYGEAILIQEPYGKTTVLIDTGDGTNNVVSTYLLAQGIKKLDMLIITHAHDDHYKEASRIIEKVQTKRIITSQYNNCMDGYSQTEKVRTNDHITIGNLTFYVYHPDQFYADENDNSLVLYVEIGGLKYLLVGDLTTKQEHNIPALDVDVLKVGHHGSNASTSLAFIKKIKPEIAIIQTGRIKQFGFPSEELILRLQSFNIQIFRTDLEYSIRYVYHKKGGYFQTVKSS